MSPFEKAVAHALQCGEAARSKLVMKDIAARALIRELKLARSRIDEVLVELGCTIPMRACRRRSDR